MRRILRAGASLVLSLLLAASLISASLAAGHVPQERARHHEARAMPAGDVVVVLNEQFLNAMLEAIFSLSNPPAIPLVLAQSEGAANGSGRTLAAGAASGQCRSEIALAREAGGVRTAVRFAEGRINAPVAFNGSYSAGLLGCLRFQGWADTEISLAFDQSRQSLIARVNVRDVTLVGLPMLLSGVIRAPVQDAIDQRVNPVELLRAEQLSAPIALSQGSSLRLRAREITHEINGSDLRLRITYEALPGN